MCQFPVQFSTKKGLLFLRRRGLLELGIQSWSFRVVAINAALRAIAIDSKDGQPLWDTTVANPKSGYSMTLAPLVIKDKVIVGTAGGERGIRGFLAAYDARTGKEAWRFNTIPGPGEAGHETWGGDSWMHGGGSVWVTGSYDPETNLTYWGVGNPNPDWDGDAAKRISRAGLK